MKAFRYGLAMVLMTALAYPALARAFDVCIDPADFRLDDVDGDGGFSAGDGFTGVGIIVLLGTIPDGGVASCAEVASERIGTFFARGRIVLGLPTAEPDDLAYVDWQFRIDGQGAIDTTGPVKTAPIFPQTIVGATGTLASADGEVLTEVLDVNGFQLRVNFGGIAVPTDTLDCNGDGVVDGQDLLGIGCP